MKTSIRAFAIVDGEALPKSLGGDVRAVHPKMIFVGKVFGVALYESSYSPGHLEFLPLMRVLVNRRKYRWRQFNISAGCPSAAWLEEWARVTRKAARWCRENCEPDSSVAPKFGWKLPKKD